MKKLLSITMLLAMLLTLCAIPAVAAETPIESDLTWYTANPDASVFFISDAADFMGLVELTHAENKDFAGKTIELTADIDFNPGWDASTTVDSSTKAVTMPTKPTNTTLGLSKFAGTLDGRGHSISGMYISNDQSSQSGISAVGLINDISGRAAVKNLVITNSIHHVIGPAATTHNTGIGGLIGRVNGADYGVAIENVYIDMDVVFETNSTDGKGMVGGIIGRVENCKTPDFTAVTTADDPKLATADDPKNGLITGYYTTMDSVVYAGNVITMTTAKVATAGVLNVSQMVGGAGQFNLLVKDSAGTKLKDSWRPIVRLTNVVTLGNIYSAKTESYAESDRLSLINLVEGAKTEGTAITATVVRQGNGDGAKSPTRWAYFDADRAAEFAYSTDAKAVIPASVKDLIDPLVPPMANDPAFTPAGGDDGDEEGTTAFEEVTTAAPETDAATEAVTDAPAEEKAGCGAVVGSAAIAVVALVAAGALGLRKKED